MTITDAINPEQVVKAMQYRVKVYAIYPIIPVQSSTLQRDHDHLNRLDHIFRL